MAAHPKHMMPTREHKQGCAPKTSSKPDFPGQWGKQAHSSSSRDQPGKHENLPLILSDCFSYSRQVQLCELFLKAAFDAHTSLSFRAASSRACFSICSCRFFAVSLATALWYSNTTMTVPTCAQGSNKYKQGLNVRLEVSHPCVISLVPSKTLQPILKS
eukprot:1159655-Pelagomonas_calceolata.AAC.1